MNRKLLNGFMAAAILLGGAASVTSCKDTDEDLFVQVKSENLTLKDKVQALETARWQISDSLKRCTTKCDSIWKKFTNDGEYKGSFDDMLNQYVKATGEHATLKWYLDQIDNALKVTNEDGTVTTYDSLSDRLGAMDAILDKVKDIKWEDFDDVFGDLEALKDALGDESMADVVEAALSADSLANNNDAVLKALLKGYEYGDKDLTNITGLLSRIEGLANTANSNATSALTLANKVKFSVDSLGGITATLRDSISLLDNKVKVNADSIKLVDNKVMALTGAFNNLISGIVLQQVSNPVFGKLALPVDVKSGMLMAYFGEGDVTFPAVNSTATEYDSKTTWISTDDAAHAGIVAEQESGVYGVEDGKLRLGTIYLSVNPASVNVEGATFDLVNSLGQKSIVDLSPLAKCTEELKFGFGRGAEAELPNGFYTTDATYNVNTISDLDALKFSVSEDFKSNVKEMLKNHRLSDVASLTKLIFDQFNNKFTAYGVRAPWETLSGYNADGTAINEKNATYSEFALATTAVRPLSYKFLYGKEFRPIGTISPIEDFTLDEKLDIKVPKFEFDFSDVQFGFTFPSITISLTGTKIEVVIPKTEILDADGKPTGNYIKEQTVEVDNLSDLERKINESLASAFEGKDAELKEAFNKAMSQVAEKINSQMVTEMDNFKTSIDKQFNDIIGNIESKVNGYLGTVNKYINKVNNLINRVNKILKDPNHYLQVTMLYEGNDGQFHQVSNNPVLPSSFKLAGGDGLKLFPTSFSGDLLVPSYKKFVAVTNAYRTGDVNKTPVSSVIATANNKEAGFNKVIAGTTTSIALKLQAGYTYEIVYSSLDFHGVTSTRKFYVSAE